MLLYTIELTDHWHYTRVRESDTAEGICHPPMTRVDFYVLRGEDLTTRLAYVCRLAEKAVEREQPVFVYGSEPAMLEQLDRLLWSFRPESFVPHRLLDGEQSPSTTEADPVQISAGEPGPDRRVLINLDTAVPPFFSRFERLLEVVDQSPAIRDAGRERYRFYQHRGYPLKHHAL